MRKKHTYNRDSACEPPISNLYSRFTFLEFLFDLDSPAQNLQWIHMTYLTETKLFNLAFTYLF